MTDQSAPFFTSRPIAAPCDIDGCHYQKWLDERAARLREYERAQEWKGRAERVEKQLKAAEERASALAAALTVIYADLKQLEYVESCANDGNTPKLQALRTLLVALSPAPAAPTAEETK